jgi:putative membrane protein
MRGSSKAGLDSSEATATSLALDRTVLANERTYAAWIRTGLAALITGLGIARFMLDAMPLWSVRVMTVFLIIFSAAAFLIASWRYENLGLSMTHLDVKMLPLALVKVISFVLAGCSFFSLFGLWYMMQ